MRKMKDSGIAWIGEIPEDWQPTKIKYVSKIAPKVDIPAEGEIGYLPMECLKRGYMEPQKKEVTELSASLNSFQDGDIVLAKVTPCFENGNIAIAQNLCNGVALGTSEIFVFRPHIINTKFMFYYMSNPIFTQNCASTMTGTGGLKRISPYYIANYLFYAPSEDEQQRIADYLDAQCAKIDSTIAKTQQIIEKLKTYKQSVITEAVTKGLNPDASMKDSGIEWIGEIPEHWNLIPFRYLLTERSEKNLPVKTSERLSLSIDKGVTLYADKTTNLDRFKDDVSQYKLAYPGDLVLNSMNMIVGATGVSEFFGCVSPVYYTYFDNNDDHVTAKFCEYLFRNNAMKRKLYSIGKGIMAIERGDERVNTCRLKVAREDLRSLKIPTPPIYEQRQIVSYLNDKCAKIDSHIVNRQKFIEKLTAYKKSLIFEVVTGKKEI